MFFRSLIAGLLALVSWACPFHTQIPSPNPIGNRPFQFNLNEVTELWIIKSDPVTNDRWFATFQQVQGHWTITASTQHPTLLDHEANHTFIAHLMDLLHDIQIQSLAPLGTTDSYGLDPPQFALRWKTAQHEWNFRLGLPFQGDDQKFFTFGEDKKIYLARGSALKMLALIPSFEFLRNPQWSLLNPDDIDELQIFHQKKLALYAQREGEDWTDRTHRKLKKDMQKFLDQVLLAQSLHLIDQPTEVEKLKKIIQLQPLYEVHLSDRHGNTARIQLKKKNQILYGINSTRPSAVFTLNPQILNYF